LLKVDITAILYLKRVNILKLYLSLKSFTGNYHVWTKIISELKGLDNVLKWFLY